MKRIPRFIFHIISTTYAVKIYKQYGDQAIEVVSRNPYQLASDIFVQMAVDKQLIVQTGYGDLANQQICYAPAFYYTEQALATRLSTFTRAPVGANLLPRVQRWVDMYTEKRNITLSHEQRHAVELAATSRLLVL